MSKQILVLGAVVLALSWLVFVSLGTARHNLIESRPTVIQNDRSKDEAADDARTLKEKAKESMNFAGLAKPNRERACSDLTNLAARSTDVIIGIPQENISKISSDGKSITLEYKVSVEYVYKGTLRQGRTITVSLPGGKVMFDDGSTAEIKTPWFKKMEDGKTYALFLTSGSHGEPFVSTGEAQGLFQIPTTRDSRVIKTQTGIAGDPMLKYHDMDVRAFLREVRKVTK